ncbi:MAG: restriction endonuclease subunit S [Leptospiraceae bacterium]|nr:restriction endonuclease subunit S [Leptospiraceae bacterium]
MNKTIADTLPDNWINTTLGNIAQLIMGQSPPGSTYNTKQKGMPFFQGKAEFGALYPVAEKWCTEPLKIAESGDVLMSVRAPVGSVNFADQKCCIGRGLCAIRLEKSLADNFYLFYYLKLIEPFLSQQGQGSTFTAINRDQLIKIKIPLPPLAEQKQIVAILQEADALRRKKKEILEKSNRLASALFLEMFGDPVRNEKGWEDGALKDNIRLQGGYAFKSSDLNSNDGIKLLKIANVNYETIDWHETTFLPNSFINSYKDFSLNVNDIVIALTRPIIQSLNAVKVGIISEKDIPCLLNQRVGRFIINEKSINRTFLKYFLYTKYFKNQIEKLVQDALLPNISTNKIESINCYKPPLPLQNDFAKKVEAIEDTTKQIENSLQKMEKLYDSLLQKAFTGNLWFDKLTMTKVS